MDPISNVDRVTALIRQKLLERARSAAAGRSGATFTATDRPTSGIAAARALAAIEGVDDRQRRRAFIQTMLVSQFGADLVNDAQFQQLVTRVSRAIEEDDECAALLSRLIADLSPK